MRRDEQMMNAAEAYAEEIGYKDDNDMCCTMNIFCAGWYAADRCSQWIPVEEELPKRMNENSRFSDTVLVYNKDGYKDTAYYDFQEKIWRWMPSITHWMPIVPPRKEDKMIATCITTDPLQTLEVGKDYEIEQYNDNFIVKYAGMIVSKEVFNEHFEVKGGQDD